MPDPIRVLETLDATDPGDLDVVLLPEVSMDVLLRFGDAAEAFAGLDRARGAGNADVHPSEQLVRPGGGATNAAHALARLGVRTHVLGETSPAGLRFLSDALEPAGVDLSGVRDTGHLHVTAAIEAGPTSIMLSPREEHDVAPDWLTGDDRRRIRDADAVLLGNWANRHASPLAREAWAEAKRGGARTYTDTSDPPEDPSRLAEMRDTLASRDLDAASVNARELCLLVPDARADAEGLRAAGETLSRDLACRVDLHANVLTASFRDGRLLATAPYLTVDPRQATGAGDTWTAGNILGDLVGLPDAERLLLANALTALYVTSDDARPPGRDALTRMLKRPPIPA